MRPRRLGFAIMLAVLVGMVVRGVAEACTLDLAFKSPAGTQEVSDGHVGVCYDTDGCADLWLCRETDAPANTTIKLKLSETGSGNVKVWNDARTEVILDDNGSTKPWSAGDVPKSPERLHFYVEGVGASGAVRDVELKATWYDTDGETVIHSDTVTVTVNEVKEVSWVGVDPGDGKTNLETTELNGGGYRLFPGKNSPTGQTHQSVKARVEMKFTVPAANKVPVFMKIHDVDDPTQNGAGNVVDTNDTASVYGDDDNRYPEGGSEPGITPNDLRQIDIGPSTATGDETFTVPADYLYPGNNWKAFAHTDIDLVIAVRVDENENVENGENSVNSFEDSRDFSKPDQKFSSPLLSLWRKLHIECDAMAADSGNTNMLTSTIDAASYDGGTDRTDLEVDAVPEDWEVDDAFNGGWIKVQNEATSPWEVVDFDENINDDDVFVAGNHVSANGKVYELGDDDYEVVEVEGEKNLVLRINHPRYPDLGKVDKVLEKCYIKHVADGGGNEEWNDPDLAFDRNITSSAEFGEQRGSGGVEADDFWVVYVLGAHQGSIEDDYDADHDPDNEGAVLGDTPEARDFEESAIYLEVIRDATNPIIMETVEQQAVIHELGHQLLELGDECHTANTIMSAELPVAENNEKFSDAHINAIRSKSASPGAD